VSLRDIAIALTTINPPTRTVELFADSPQVGKIYVAGDSKTPDSSWKLPNLAKIQYLPITQHEDLSSALARSVPEAHYSRKLFAYLAATRDGAEAIIDTDDDNFLDGTLGDVELDDKWLVSAEHLGWCNIHGHFGAADTHPRGLPLEEILGARTKKLCLHKSKVRVGVLQWLVNGDPDLDAIHRLTREDFPVFEQKAPIALGLGSVSPFNSQNTLFRRECFPLLYLPTTVSFRYTDILRSVVAQPIMWSQGFLLGVASANSTQVRNVHNHFEDFLSEIPMYTTVNKAFDIANSVTKTGSMQNDLYETYAALAKERIVGDGELSSLEAWLSALEKP